MTTKYCNCKGCRYPEHHLTSYHTCGACGSFGHGQQECHKNHSTPGYVDDYSFENELHESMYEKILISSNPTPMYSMKLKFTQLPTNMHCTVPTCKTKYIHSTQSHNDFFSKDKFGSATGPDKYGILARKKYIEINGPEMVKQKNNSYIAMYWGQGNVFIYRNKNGEIQQLEHEYGVNEEQYNNFVTGLQQIKEPSILTTG